MLGANDRKNEAAGETACQVCLRILRTAMTSGCLAFATYSIAIASESTRGAEALVQLEVMAAGLREAVRVSSFYGTYEVRSGIAANLKDAKSLADAFFSEREESATIGDVTHDGIVCKMGDLRRLRKQSKSGPQRIEPLTGHHLSDRMIALQGRGYDEVTDGRLQLRFSPTEGEYRGIACIEEANDFIVGHAFAGPNTQSEISPLSLGGQAPADVIEALRAEGAKGAHLEIRPNHPEMGYVEVGSRSTSATSSSRRTAVLWTQSQLPALVEYAREDHRDGRVVGTFYRMGQLIACGEVHLPRKILRIYYNGEQEPCEFTAWSSKDLGERAPAHHDFVVEIAPEVTVQGLLAVPSRGTVRRLDITKIDRDNVKYTQDNANRARRMQNTEVASPLVADDQATPVWLIGNCLAVMVILLIAFLRKSKRFAKP